MHEKRILCLVDNFGHSCALGKGRAASYGLLQITRRSASLQLAMGSSVSTRRILSEKNLADRPSRIFEPWSSCERHVGPVERPGATELSRADLEGRSVLSARPAATGGTHGWNPPAPPRGTADATIPLRVASGRRRGAPELRQALRGPRAVAPGDSRSGPQQREVGYRLAGVAGRVVVLWRGGPYRREDGGRCSGHSPGDVASAVAPSAAALADRVPQGVSAEIPCADAVRVGWSRREGARERRRASGSRDHCHHVFHVRATRRNRPAPVRRLAAAVAKGGPHVHLGADHRTAVGLPEGAPAGHEDRRHRRHHRLCFHRTWTTDRTSATPSRLGQLHYSVVLRPTPSSQTASGACSFGHS